jgi:hypothetical protein
MMLRYARLSPDRLRDAVASLDGLSAKSTQSPVESGERLVSTHAPVAQLDRASDF